VRLPLIAVLAGLAGLLLIGVILQDAFEVMLLPRRVHRRRRLMRLFFEATWAVWSRLARYLPDTAREGFLSVFGALSMMLLFMVWAGGLIVGFGLLEWAFQLGRVGASSPLSEQFYMSGATFFTLGYGDIAPHTASARVAAVVEAGTGLGFIAVVIGYLPVLYQLFARREAHVLQLDGRAGSPPTAIELLCRHAEGNGLTKLDELLREWEIWGSELLESHLSYPMLVYYRSQHGNQSWLAAMGAIMDACALILVGVEGAGQLQAGMTFSMARQVLVEMARSFAIMPSRYTGSDRLDHAAFLRMLARLEEAGLVWTAGEAGEETLVALRATYEPLLDGLGCYLLLALPSWAALDDSSDHWEAGPRGLIASRLVKELTGRSAAPAETGAVGAKPWRRLRERLREPE
jgi:hypothetical protein